MAAEDITPKQEKGIKDILWNDFTKIIYIVALVVGVYKFITSPQIQQYTAIEILKEQVASQQKTIDSITKTQQNDTQEVKAGLSETKNKVEELNTAVIQLRTIIDERIPVKK